MRPASEHTRPRAIVFTLLCCSLICACVFPGDAAYGVAVTNERTHAVQVLVDSIPIGDLNGVIQPCSEVVYHLHSEPYSSDRRFRIEVRGLDGQKVLNTEQPASRVSAGIYQIDVAVPAAPDNECPAITRP
jgi:hypothetical protein